MINLQSYGISVNPNSYLLIAPGTHPSYKSWYYCITVRLIVLKTRNCTRYCSLFAKSLILLVFNMISPSIILSCGIAGFPAKISPVNFVVLLFSGPQRPSSTRMSYLRRSLWRYIQTVVKMVLFKLLHLNPQTKLTVKNEAIGASRQVKDESKCDIKLG